MIKIYDANLSLGLDKQKLIIEEDDVFGIYNSGLDQQPSIQIGYVPLSHKDDGHVRVGYICEKKAPIDRKISYEPWKERIFPQKSLEKTMFL